MRTEQLWDERVKERMIVRHFPPRIQDDLRNITEPEFDNTAVQSTYIHGASHFGKTIYACFLMLNELKRMYLNEINGQCYFVAACDLVYELKATFDKTTALSENDVINKYKTCHLLLLDDFGTTIPSEWMYQVIYTIINYRYEQLLPTIFTSNLDLNALSEFFKDGRIPSRIERMGKVVKKTNYKNKQA